MDQYMWYRPNSSGATHEVGGKLANPWGLHDMHGNVWEWCSDWKHPDYYEVSPSDDPQGPASGTYRVVRGGGWIYGGFDSRCANRSWVVPTNVDAHIGLRVVLAP